MNNLWNYRTDKELLQFINTPLAEIHFNPRIDTNAAIKMRDRINYLETHSASFYGLLKQRLYLLKAFDWIKLAQKQRTEEIRVYENRSVNEEESLAGDLQSTLFCI